MHLVGYIIRMNIPVFRSTMVLSSSGSMCGMRKWNVWQREKQLQCGVWGHPLEGGREGKNGTGEATSGLLAACLSRHSVHYTAC